MTREQRLHREADPRVGRSLGLTAVCAVFLVVVALVVVAVRVQQVRLAYQLDAPPGRAAREWKRSSASSRSSWPPCARRAGSSRRRASSG